MSPMARNQGQKLTETQQTRERSYQKFLARSRRQDKEKTLAHSIWKSLRAGFIKGKLVARELRLMNRYYPHIDWEDYNNKPR